MARPGPPRPNRLLPGHQLALPLWEFAARYSLGAFRQQLRRGPARNEETLRAILRRSAATEFGRRNGFDRLLRSPRLGADYARALPVAGYDHFRADFQRIAGGARDVLFPGAPRLFVSTSGTTGDPKLFPVTPRQQNAALKFIALLTPAARAACVPGLGFRQPTATLMVASRPGRATEAGIPVGNPSGAGLRRVMALAPPFWVFPAPVLTVQDHPTALYLHALFALRAPDLGCIEAIYCSHIVSWMGLIAHRAGDLARDIADGTLARDLVLATGERAALGGVLAPDPARARAVERALTAGPDGLMTRLWPDLKVLSSVVSGAFAVSVPRLRQLAGPGPALYTTCFGATEGLVGINLRADAPEHYVLALGAVHLEFLPLAELEAAEPRAVGIADVEMGGRYEVVLTNHAGLFRYRLGDVVRIVDLEGTTPVFAFDHRLGNVLDLVGEKTTEQHLHAAVGRLARDALGGGQALVDFLVWPDIEVTPYRYVIYVELARTLALPDAATLAARLDALLAAENPAYLTLGRANGRLDAVVLRWLVPGTLETFLDRHRAATAGANANQAKIPRLLRNQSQRDWLDRNCLAPVPPAAGR